MLDSVNFYVREYKLLENKTIILENFLTPNRKKFAIVEAPIERQNYIRIAKDAINFLVRSSSFNIYNPENSSTSDDSFDDNKYIAQPRNEAENLQTLKNEIEAYELDSNTEKDPLLYWKNHIQDFPNLSILSSEFLAIPASTTPSERLFQNANIKFLTEGIEYHQKIKYFFKVESTRLESTEKKFESTRVDLKINGVNGLWYLLITVPKEVQ
ncbi:zinc finger BED domain-containing 1-like [Brachionus plicatilis]|uniref:Zinc finger BED domain-containing 1-like n=1 Tax=Brachionus plicatilis TaxID=10195 RepID=A0A3M7SJC9_BRAPC|nr:zinc finger BED domain-containing 1-like [Brachionus plicatilis]